MYAALKFYKCSTPKLQPLIAVLSMKGSEPEIMLGVTEQTVYMLEFWSHD